MIYAVIVAGGSGTRMNSKVPKQFLELEGKPILYHTIQRFLNAISDIQLVLVLPQETKGEEFLAAYFPNHTNINIAIGGPTRYHSVQSGLRAIEHDGIVLIHDGVRPFVSHTVIKRCIEIAIEKGNAIPCIDLKDSIRKLEIDGNKSVNRNEFKAVQTPQTFQVSLLRKAFEQEYQPEFTDDAAVLENIGLPINLVQGNEENIKITTPLDLVMAAWILKNVSLD